MSAKMLFVIAALGAGYWAVSRVEPPVPTGAEAADSLTIANVSFGARFQYSVGAVGASILGSSIRKSVDENEETLRALRGTLKSAKGPDGVRARNLAKKIIYVDSVTVDHLEQGRPIKAMRESMEAKSMLGGVKRILNQGV